MRLEKGEVENTRNQKIPRGRKDEDNHASLVDLWVRHNTQNKATIH